MVKENLKKIFDELSVGNALGEKITLLGATKFVDVSLVNEAIAAGLRHIGENKAQEFRDKFPFYSPVRKHFIGRLQSNKLKYVVGKADCIDSVDSFALAAAISERAQAAGIKQDIMLEVNVGEEEQKGGFLFSEVKSAYKSINALNGIKITGLMAMLPIEKDELIAYHTRKMRELFDLFKSENKDVEFLSVGTSGDYKITIKNGSNMIRLGTAIFGERDYGGK